jgi:hypothetical protein
MLGPRNGQLNIIVRQRKHSSTMATESSRFTRSETELLRSLVAEAWAEELNHSLEEQFENFMKWADDAMSPFEVVEEMHIFHNGIARELYKKYAGPLVSTTVAKAIAENHIKESDLNDGLLGKLKAEIATFRKLVGKRK